MRSSIWSSLFLLAITMSSMYLKMLQPICFPRMFVASLENVESTFFRTLGIRTNQYVPKGVINLVFALSSSCKFDGSSISSLEETLLHFLPLSRRSCLF
jgi:hypothetical protein